jgi:hypothetical protein
MSDDLFGRRDAEALADLQTFAQGIAAAPGTYQVSVADATAITNSVDAFAAGLADSRDPATRTKITVAVKDELRASCEQLCRQFSMLIKYNAGISDADKLAIGIKPVNNTRTPRHVAGTSPLLNILLNTPGEQSLRYADSTTPDSAAKPAGAVSIQIYRAIAEAPIADPDLASFYGNFTRNPVAASFSAADRGKIATYYARWQGKRGDVGPWSLPVSMAIAA